METMTNGASKKIRAPGELQALIADVLKKNPKATHQEAAERLGISVPNARMSMTRFKRNNGIKMKVAVKKETKTMTTKKTKKKVSIAPGSAVAQLMGMGGSQLTKMEARFVALIAFVGYDRASTLLHAEGERLLAMVGGGT